MMRLLLPACVILLLPWMEAVGMPPAANGLDALVHALAWLGLGVWLLRRQSGWPWWLPWLLPAAAVTALSAAGAAYGYAALAVVVEQASALALAVSLAFWIAHRGNGRDVALLYVVAQQLAAAVAVGQTVFSGGRGTAGFVNPNHLAAFLVAGAPLLLVVARSLLPRVLLTAGAAAGLLASGSRGGLAVAGVLLLLATGSALRARAGNPRLAVAAVAGLLLFGAAAGLTLQQRFAEGTDIYRYDRLRIWPSSLAMHREAPWLGIGPGQFRHRAPAYNFPREDAPVRYGRVFRRPHSHLLLILVETGRLGTLLLLLTAGALAWEARRRETSPSPEVRAARHGLLALAILSLVDQPLTQPSIRMAGAVLLALALPAAVQRRSPRLEARLAAATLLATLLTAGVIFPALSRHLSIQAASTADPVLRSERLRLAARLDPLQASPPGEEAALLLRHAREPMDVRSYARIRLAIDHAVRLSPQEPLHRITRARLFRRACIELLRDDTSCDGAAREYRHAVERAPRDPRILREAASFARLMGRHAHAEELLMSAVTLEPDYVAAWQDLVALPGGDRWSPDLRAARQRAAVKVPDSPYSREILGHAGGAG